VNYYDIVSSERTLSFLTDRLIVSGDLSHADSESVLEQLDYWVSKGVTDVLDVRAECSDENFVGKHQPHMKYNHLGVHDDGAPRDPLWFAAGVKVTLDAFARSSDSKVLIHCHMGINRAPSMAYAVLLAQGVDCVKALDIIRSSRPMAQIIYADSALKWFSSLHPSVDYRESKNRVDAWFDANFTRLGRWNF
jgi:dual specificity phosphatase 3